MEGITRRTLLEGGACENVCVAGSYGGYAASGKRGVNIKPWKGGDGR